MVEARACNDYAQLETLFYCLDNAVGMCVNARIGLVICRCVHSLEDVIARTNKLAATRAALSADTDTRCHKNTYRRWLLHLSHPLYDHQFTNRRPPVNIQDAVPLFVAYIIWRFTCARILSRCLLYLKQHKNSSSYVTTQDAANVLTGQVTWRDMCGPILENGRSNATFQAVTPAFL